MSNRFHSKYHRTNHHTDTNLMLSLTNPDGSPRNPDSGHDPIASPEHPFMGRFCLKGGLSAITSETNTDKAAGIFIARNLNEDACRFYGPIKLSGSFVLQDNLINADMNTHKVGINIEPSTYSGFDLIVNDSVNVLENTTTKTLNSNYITLNTEGQYSQYPLDVLSVSNSNHYLTMLSSGYVGINLGTAPDFEDQNLKVIGNTLFDAINKKFQIKGQTEINHSTASFTTKIGTHATAGQVSIGKNEMVKFTTNSNVSAGCDFIISRNLYLSGSQTIAGNLNIQGNLSALGTYTQLDTFVSTTSAMSVYNTGTTTALTVTQTGNTDIADFKDETGTVLFVDNDRRVGVLTNNPTYTLDVVGTTRSTEGLRLNANKDFFLGNDTENSVNDGASIRYQYASNTNSRLIIRTFDEGNEPIVFQQSDNSNQYNRLVIGTNGNVGIGMNALTGIESFPSTLSVYGEISANGNMYSTGQLSIQRALTIGRTDSLKEGGQIDLCNAFNNTTAYSIDVYSNVDNSNTERLRIWDAATSTERFTIHKNGNVGIGSFPDLPTNQKLTISGNVSAIGNITINSGNYLSLTTNGVDTRILRNTTSNGMEFFTNNISRFFIDDSGNIGIGTTIPNQKLSVIGSISASGNINNTGTITSTGNITTYGTLSSIGNITTSGSLSSVGNINTTGAITSTGNITTYGTLSSVGNITTSGSLSSVGNINTTGAITSTGNMTTYGTLRSVGNITTSGSLSSVGNINTTGAIRSTTFISAISSIGYSLGSGLTAVQTTSRTTPVTIHKPCGSITLFSVSPVVGTWVTFTVNNNLVAATDTILLSYFGGSNTYVVTPGKVTHGVSFAINLVSIAGTAIDAPVVNYTIIKSVSA